MLYQSQIVESQSYDLVVCGGGVTGFAAAISAARKGLKTAIVEKFGCFGGVATTCNVNHLLGGRKYDETSGNIIRKVGGLFDELTDRLIMKGGAIDPDTIDIEFNPHGWYPRMAAGIPFEGEQLKVLMDEMIQAENIDIYFFTNFIDVIISENQINQIILHNKNGLFAVNSRVVVDATGDADVASKSGCHIVKGRKEDHLTSPASLQMHVEHVDYKKFVEYQNTHQSPKLVEIINDLKQKNIWTFPYEIFIAIQLTEPDVFMINTIRQVGIDGTNANSITTGMINGRKENMELFKIMKKHFPGFEHARIRKISEMIGIRETRRIVGEYTVTVKDAISGKQYKDCIASTTYNFDLPDPLKPSYDPMMGNAANPNAKREHDSIKIPYRSLLPSTIDNLIVAGRCISVEREVLGPVRIMGPCMGIGQAAGIASALAINNNSNYKSIDINELRQNLIESGCLLPS